MRRALILLLIISGMVMLGCAEKKPTIEKPIPTEQAPTEQAPKPTETPARLPTETPVEDINKTLTSVDELLKELQDVENVSFNL